MDTERKLRKILFAMKEEARFKIKTAEKEEEIAVPDDFTDVIFVIIPDGIVSKRKRKKGPKKKKKKTPLKKSKKFRQESDQLEETPPKIPVKSTKISVARKTTPTYCTPITVEEVPWPIDWKNAPILC